MPDIQPIPLQPQPAAQPVTPEVSSALHRRAAEQKRLEALHELDLLDTAREEEYEEIVQLASAICDAPISLVSLVDSERQWFKASVGTDLTETHRDYSFCAHAIQKPDLFMVEDATLDPRFDANPLVTRGPMIRFYAGIPLESPGHFALGTLCVIDTVPRTLTVAQQSGLRILARQVQARIELRAQQKSLERALIENMRLAASLQSSNDTFRAFMDNGPFISYVKDEEGRMVFYNAGMARRFGVSRDAWIGRKDHDLWPRETADRFRELDLKVLEGGIPIESLESTPAPDGGETQWKSYKFVIRPETGERLLAGISIDITDQIDRDAELHAASRARNELLDQLETSRVLMRTFQDNSPNQTYIKSEDGRYLSYNRAFAEHFKIDSDAWIGRTDREVLPAAIADGFRSQDLQVLNTGLRLEVCSQIRNSAGETATYRTIKFPIAGVRGERLVGGVAFDITDDIHRQEALATANRQLELLATTDPLTGLVNRRVFDERTRTEYAISERRGRQIAVLVMDIDDFKQRNDLFGHAAGDEALRKFGRVLLETARTGDIPARIGGEEFAILLPETSAAQARRCAERIQSLLQQLRLTSGDLTVSIGIASKNATTGTWERLVACSDDAMYEAKRSGKNRIVIHGEHVEQLMHAAARIS